MQNIKNICCKAISCHHVHEVVRFRTLFLLPLDALATDLKKEDFTGKTEFTLTHSKEKLQIGAHVAEIRMMFLIKNRYYLA